jgi:hypothetical protein
MEEQPAKDIAMKDIVLPPLTPIGMSISSNIEGIGYDEEVLAVKFRSGPAIYVYDEVTPDEYHAIMDAPGAGLRMMNIFDTLIKQRKKPFKKIDPERVSFAAEVIPIGPAPTGSRDELARDAASWRAKVAGFLVVDLASHEAAQKMLVELAERRNKVIDFFKKHKANAHKVWKDLCDDERNILAPYVEAETLLKQRAGQYHYDQLKAAAALDEQRRMAAESEARARAVKEADDMTLAAAEELHAMGDTEGAQLVLEHPMEPEIRYNAPLPVQPAVAEVEGMGGRIEYKVKIHDLVAVPREYLVVDIDKTEAHISRLAKASRGRLQIPGCSIRETYAVRRTGRRA